MGYAKVIGIGINPISAQIRDMRNRASLFGIIPKLWSEPTVLAWNQAGHRAKDGITDALLQMYVNGGCITIMLFERLWG